MPRRTPSAAGRGAKYPHLLRSRVSAEELEVIKENAARAGMSVCKFVRTRATGGHVTSKIELKTLQALNSIGRNLHQMWKEGHDTRPALAAVQAAAEALKGGVQ